MEGIQRHISGSLIRHLAAEVGFQIAGLAAASPSPDFGRYKSWAERGLAGEMGYLADHRADLRGNLEELLPGVRSVISVGMMYNGPEPKSTEFSDAERGWIARYAWSSDYHGVIRAKLQALAAKLLQIEDFRWRACVDTAPVPERSFARAAGLGWIGRNTCLISQQHGSFFFLGELLTTLELEPDTPAPSRCGTCTRCIQACPTDALIPTGQGEYELDARRCISYFTIELRSEIPVDFRAKLGNHVFGCDICQDVCPWNRKAERSAPPALENLFAPPLERLAGLTETQFKQMFRDTPVNRARYTAFLRNVAVAMGNSGLPQFESALRKLEASPYPLIAEHARWAIARLTDRPDSPPVASPDGPTPPDSFRRG